MIIFFKYMTQKNPNDNNTKRSKYKKKKKKKKLAHPSGF